MDITFLLGSSLIAALLVQVLKNLFGEISVRFGSLVTQLLLLVVSFAVALIGFFFNKLPAEFITTTGLVFVSAMAIYEVVWKALYQEAVKGAKAPENPNNEA